MNRSFMILLGFFLPVHSVAEPPVAPDQGPPTLAGQRPGAEPACGQVGDHITLRPDEFELDAYDAQGQILAVRPAHALDAHQGRAHAMKLRFAKGQSNVQLPLAPEALMEAKAAHASDRLRLALPVRMVVPRRPAPERPCQEGEITVEVLTRGAQLSVVEVQGTGESVMRVLPAHPRRIKRPVGRAWIGRVRVDQDSPPVETDGLGALLEKVAHRCMERALITRPSVKGALTIEIRRAPTGQLRRPALGADGLACDFVFDCLSEAIYRGPLTPRLERALPPGGGVHVPFYFDGALLPESQISESQIPESRISDAAVP